MRSNVFIGFPLGGALSPAIAATTTLVFLPASVQVDTLAQVALPVAVALGKIGLAVALLGFFAATFGAACETGLSVGYSIAQYMGDHVNGRLANLLGSIYLVLVLAASLAAIPLMIVTKAGQ